MTDTDGTSAIAEPHADVPPNDEQHGTVTPLRKTAPARKNSDNDDGEKSSRADILAGMATRLFRFVADNDGVVYGIRRGGAPIAIPLRGTGPNSIGSVRQTLIRAYYEKYRKAVGPSPVADAIGVVEAMTIGESVTPLYLRVAPDSDSDGTWIDLGTRTGHCIHIQPGQWTVQLPNPHRGGPVFRRTRLIGELPNPVRNPDGWQPGIDELLKLLNVSQETWPLLVGWLLAAMLYGIPCPIAFLTGFQGSGKTSAGLRVLDLIDPKPAKLRSVPKDEKDLAVSAAAGWVLGLDNISTIPEWLSDALCRIVTGDGYMARSLYSDTDVSVLEFQRPILLTSIDAGALRADMADRLLRVELDRITSQQRKGDKQLRQAFDAARPRILGGLCELLAQVFAELPAARKALTERPRMADFAELLAALDRVAGTKALQTYLDSREDLSSDVVDSSPVLSALRKFIDSCPDGQWEGTPDRLLEELTRRTFNDFTPEKHWPRTASVFSSAVKRGAPAMISVGYQVDGLERKRKVNGRSVKYWQLRAPL